MAWTLLIIAGLFEIAMATCLKQSKGFTVLWPSVGFVVTSIASFGLLSMALKTLPVGVAYAVWTGIGAAGTAAVGMLYLGDAIETVKIVSIALIIAGVIGLQLSVGH
jgi:quaternary ammonium compound-resistance protein SugE